MTNVSINGNSQNYVGGVAGKISSLAALQNCYVLSGTINGYTNIGGIAGLIDAGLGGAIQQCFSKNVAISGYLNVGGIVGTHNGGLISDCYSRSAVTASAGNAGGLVGYLHVSAGFGYLMTSYSTCPVSVTTGNIGGLIGYLGTAMTPGLFWDYQAAGMTSDSRAKTTAEMKTESTFTGWNFTTDPIIWHINGTDNDGYPHLAWENYTPAPTITSFSPATAGSGTYIAITGTNFTGATSVSFGGTAASNVTVVDATTITAMVTSGTTGTVSVTTPGGTATSGGTFTYKPAFVTNLSNENNGSVSTYADGTWNGQAFKTDNNTRNLGSVDLSIPYGGDHAVVKIYSSSAGELGSAITTLTGSFVSGDIYNFTPQTPILLTANTTYWLVLYSTYQTISTEYTAYHYTSTLTYYSGEGTIPATKRTADSQDAGGMWAYYSDPDPSSEPYMFAVYGDIILPVTWDGSESTSWSTPANWSGNAVPTSSDDAVIPDVANDPIVNITNAVCNNLSVSSGAVLTIAAGKALTVSGTLTNNSTGGVVIESDPSGTGSLIMETAAGTGTTVAKRYVTGNATAPYPWHIISSPVTGQELNTSFMTTNAIASSATTNKWGFGTYNEPGNAWDYYLKGFTGTTFTLGKGYDMASTVTGAMSFTGTPQADNKAVTLTRGTGTAGSIGWNAIGNPFTSSISVADFFTANGSQLDASFGALYVWNPVKSGGADYETITAVSGDPYIPVGQGFCVNAASNGVTINFLKTMRTHQPTATFKSGTPLWPGISLKAEMNDLARITTIYFNSAMTPGLDRNYDAGLFKSGSGLDFYTRLVQNNGIDFGIQCLPDFGFDEMVIPLGIDRKAGGEVTFTAVLTNLPSGCQPVLEDRQLGKRIDLSKAGVAYKVTLPANTAGTGRFYLHLAGSTGIPDIEAPDLKVYSVAKEIHIEGTVSSESIATLYDLTGKSVGSYKLKAANVHILKPVGITEGVYLLRIVENNEQKYAGKINLQ